MTDLRTLRKRLGLTQTQLAELLQTSQQTISEQETGKIPVRRERMLAMTALVLFQDGIADPLARAAFAEILPPIYR